MKNGQSRETANIGYGTQDEEKQSKTKTQYVLDTTIPNQTQTFIYSFFGLSICHCPFGF
jgi:hypothetical protein